MGLLITPISRKNAQKLNGPDDFRKILREAGARQCEGALQFSGNLLVSNSCEGVGRKKKSNGYFFKSMNEGDGDYL